MLSPLDYEGAILQKEMEVEQREAGNQILELTEDPTTGAGTVRFSLAKLLVGISLKLDPSAVARLASGSPEDPD